MPVDSETLAYIAAGGTAVGALIGSASGGAVQAVLARKADKRRSKIAARLVRADLAMAASYLRAAEKDGAWWVFYDTGMRSWTEHRDALAGHLSDAEFETVSQSAMELAQFHEKLCRAPESSQGFRSQGFLSMPNSGPGMRLMRKNATDAWNVLSKPAKGDRMTGLLHEDE